LRMHDSNGQCNSAFSWPLKSLPSNHPPSLLTFWNHPWYIWNKGTIHRNESIRFDYMMKLTRIWRRSNNYGTQERKWQINRTILLMDFKKLDFFHQKRSTSREKWTCGNTWQSRWSTTLSPSKPASRIFHRPRLEKALFGDP
jgi:hypothetical protein